MKIAVVGTGIAGITAASMLHRKHEVTVFEAEARLGGHSHTVEVTSQGRQYAVDTGFIVYNERTYPNFINLLRQHDVATQPAPMSFSVRSEAEGLEYSSQRLFAQRRRWFDRAHHRMIRDILLFNRSAQHYVQFGQDHVTLGEFVRRNAYSSAFIDRYLVPMLAAIWSAEPEKVLEFPAKHFLAFFENHGLLNVWDRPQWRVIKGGSREYVRRFTEPFADCVRLHCPVERIGRVGCEVVVKPRGAEPEFFDHVILATHSDTSLQMLSDATPLEREVLEAIRYQRNEVVLHTDVSLLPVNRRAWACWNYRTSPVPGGPAKLTYNMNLLQGLDAPETFCVTLNDTGSIDPRRILGQYAYDHPVFDLRALQAQRRHAEISGRRGVHFCGAYWGYGFHEDGVKSALAVVEAIEKEDVKHAQRAVSRLGAAPAIY